MIINITIIQLYKKSTILYTVCWRTGVGARTTRCYCNYYLCVGV